MQNLPAIQLLESTHHFPGPYMFKVIGRAESGFMAQVVAAVREELAEGIDPPFKVRSAQGGRHLSITLEPTVQTPEQVLAIYQRIQKITGLVFLW